MEEFCPLTGQYKKMLMASGSHNLLVGFVALKTFNLLWILREKVNVGMLTQLQWYHPHTWFKKNEH